MPTYNYKLSQEKSQNHVRRDFEKTTPTVATPVIATQTQNSNLSQEKHRETLHDLETDAGLRDAYRRNSEFQIEPTEATGSHKPILEKRRASRRMLTITNQANRSLSITH
jgi:hypothetical protein